MTQPDLFDAAEGCALRDRGVKRVQQNAATFLEKARAEAKRISGELGEVCIDDLRRWAYANGTRPHDRNAWGALFRPVKSSLYPERPGWSFLGYKPSEFTSNRRRVICRWRWTE